MNQLIPVSSAVIGADQMQACDARELHAFLEVGRDFTTWIKSRIDQYGFVQGQDFEVFTDSGENLQGGRPSKVFVLSLDMAKQLAMVENNDRGRQARRYFIECERVAKASTPQPLIAGPTDDRVAAILRLGQAIASVPGVRPGIAAAATLACVHTNTGIAIEDLRRALPAALADEAVCTHNATQLGKLVGASAKAINLQLAGAGLQVKNERGEWQLTAAGQEWGEALPFASGRHAGYQVLWNPSVVEWLRNAA